MSMHDNRRRQMKRLARTMPARELVAELVARLGEAEIRRRLRLPATADLGRFADKLDGIAS